MAWYHSTILSCSCTLNYVILHNSVNRVIDEVNVCISLYPHTICSQLSFFWAGREPPWLRSVAVSLTKSWAPVQTIEKTLTFGDLATYISLPPRNAAPFRTQEGPKQSLHSMLQASKTFSSIFHPVPSRSVPLFPQLFLGDFSESEVVGWEPDGSDTGAKVNRGQGC